MKIYFPRNFTTNNMVPDLLKQVQIMFRLENKLKQGIRYDLSSTHKISMFGTLILYKIIDYAYRNRCFESPRIIGKARYLRGVWKLYGFFDLMESYIQQNHNETSYTFYEFSAKDMIIFAPQPLLKKHHTYINEYLQNVFTPALYSFYSDNNLAAKMVFDCISELIGNFWSHATDDSSMLIAEGRKDYIEIGCTDTGKGIITTMKESKQLNVNFSPDKILLKALQKNITSKPGTAHMGYGLWLIDQIVKAVKGKLYIYTEGYYYGRESERSFVKPCGYWKGVIIYLYLPLKNPVSPASFIKDQLKSTQEDILINFI